MRVPPEVTIRAFPKAYAKGKSIAADDALLVAPNVTVPVPSAPLVRAPTVPTLAAFWP